MAADATKGHVARCAAVTVMPLSDIFVALVRVGDSASEQLSGAAALCELGAGHEGEHPAYETHPGAHMWDIREATNDALRDALLTQWE